MTKFEEDVKKAYSTLELERKIVGVKFFQNKEEFQASEGSDLKQPIHYCVAVKSATLGNRIKMTKETSKCGGSTRSLGFEKPKFNFYNGEEGCSLGLFKDKLVAMNCAKKVTNVLTDTYGVLVQPIEYFTEDFTPDVAIFVGNPRETMRVLQGYTFNYGLSTSIGLSGNQGICVEATAYPLINNTINVSLLCAETRFASQWTNEELAIGLPFTMFSKTVDGICKTISPVEQDNRKKEIKENLEKVNIDNVQIEFGKTYYN